MENASLIFCDPEEEYLLRLSTFLQNVKNFPWEVIGFSDTQEFLKYVETNDSACMLVTEEVLEELHGVEKERVILLNESGLLKHPEYVNVHKYQAADRVARQLLQVYGDRKGRVFPNLGKDSKTRRIGMFSPAAASMQGIFAKAYGQVLAKAHRCLLVTFEYYGEPEEELDEVEQKQDILSLLYVMKTEKQKFAIRLQSICHKKEELDYILPTFMGQNLTFVQEKEWLELLQAIEDTGLFEYILLDCREGIQGLYRILQECSKVYTLDILEEGVSIGRTGRYERILELNHFEEILQKTKKVALPALYHRSEGIVEWSKSEIVRLARICAEEDL